MDKILSLSKRRGLVFQSSEIYGGINATWDYGPLGVELKRNLKDLWWHSVVQQRDDVVGLDAAILMHPEVWVSSGHVASFSDPLVECRECHQRYREDQIEIDQLPRLWWRADRPSPVQLDVQNVHGPGRRHRPSGVPAT